MHIALKTSLIAAPVIALIACGPTSATTSSTGSHTTSSTGSTSSTGGKASSSTSSMGTGGSGPTAMAACAAQAHATCEEREKCSQNGYENKLNYGSETDCEMRSVLTCITALMAKD